MKRKTIALLIFAAVAVLLPVNTVYAKKRYSTEYKTRVLSMVVPTHTTAAVTEDCTLRESPALFSEAVAELKQNTIVEILQDSSEKWYKIESADNDASGWLPARLIQIRETQQPALCEMSVDELEAFVNIMDFPSGTDFFVWTDIARQKTHIFKKTDCYKLVKTIVCSSGKNSSPTTRGFFTVNGRGEWFYSGRFRSGAKFWVRFNGTYLFHSLAMDKNKKVTENILGERRSSGCIRFGVAEAEWFYKTIPDGTSVFIY